RPRADDGGPDDTELGVFALGHLVIAVDTPDDRADQQDPADMPILNTETGGISVMLNVLGIAFWMGHSTSPGWRRLGHNLHDVAVMNQRGARNDDALAR